MKFDSDEFTISRSSWTPERKNSVQNLILAEKSFVSMRFSHRRAIKSIPKARKVLRVSKPKQRNMLESIWGTRFFWSTFWCILGQNLPSYVNHLMMQWRNA